MFMSCDLGDFGDSLEEAFTEPIGGKQSRPEVQVTTGNIEDLAKEAAGNPEYSLYLLKQIANASEADKKKMQGTAVKLAIDAADLGGALIDGLKDLKDVLVDGGGGLDGAKTLVDKLKTPTSKDTVEALKKVFGTQEENIYDLSDLAKSGVNADDMAFAGLTLLASNIGENEDLEDYFEGVVDKLNPKDPAAVKNAVPVQVNIAYAVTKKETHEAIARAAAALTAFDPYADDSGISPEGAGAAALAVVDAAGITIEGATEAIADVAVAFSQFGKDAIKMGAALAAALITEDNKENLSSTVPRAFGTFAQYGPSAVISTEGPEVAAAYAAALAAAANHSADDYTSCKPGANALAAAVLEASGASSADEALATEVKAYVIKADPSYTGEKTELSAVMSGDPNKMTLASVLPTISTKGVDGEELIDAELKLGFALISTAADKGGGMISDQLSDMFDSF
jgi:hypothetical protein